MEDVEPNIWGYVKLDQKTQDWFTSSFDWENGIRSCKTMKYVDLK